jgi:glycosyltransferase involved in cell wall biosynthesis
MKLLCLSPRQSWPITSGAKLRDYYLARALSRMGDLTYVFYQSSGAAPGETGFSFSSRVMPVPAPRLYRPAKVLKGLLGRWPLPVLNYTSPALIDTLANLLKRETFDVIHVDSVHLSAVMEPLRQACGKARIFYNWHNIESELMSRYAGRALSFLHRAYALRTAQALRQAERHILETAHGHIVCSPRERSQLLAIAPQARIATIENGVDTTLVSSAGDPPEGRSTIIFVGAMSYHANVDGAVYFARDVWPALRARYPRFDLALVGADPSPAVRALGSLTGITVTGTVEEILPYYHQAFAAVVPLRIGGGTRLKILEAMAAGVPVISTAIGAEGLEVTPEKNILLAETPEDWLRTAGQIEDPAAWLKLAGAGRKLVEDRYDWTKLGERLEETYRTWIAESSKP